MSSGGEWGKRGGRDEGEWAKGEEGGVSFPTALTCSIPSHWSQVQ